MICKEASRKDWTANLTDGLPRDAAINIGSLQRIADACETMAQNWTSLTTQRDEYRRFWNNELARRYECERRISALKGVITKLKKKHAPRLLGRI